MGFDIGGWVNEEIEPTLDSFDGESQTIKPPINARQPLFDRSQSDLKVEYLIDDTIELLVEPTHILRQNAIRLVCHRPTPPQPYALGPEFRHHRHPPCANTGRCVPRSRDGNARSGPGSPRPRHPRARSC